jgi:hypothetical protein
MPGSRRRWRPTGATWPLSRRERRDRAVRSKGWGAALAVLLLLAVSPPAAAAGVISGRLVNKTPGGQSVAGVEVVLARDGRVGDEEGRRVRTDRQGRFRFEGIPAGADLRYRLTVRYLGAEYTADPVSPAGQGGKELVIPLWDATGDPAAIRVARHHILVEAGEEGLRVQEFMAVRNLGDRTFVGTRPVSGDRRATLQFTLPRGYAAVQYGEGLMECCVVPVEQGFVDTMDVKPGTRELTFTYQLAPGADRYTLLRPLDYPTDGVDLFISPAALTVSSETLTDRGRIAGQGREYLRWGRDRLEGGAVLAAELAGLPASKFLWRWLVYGAVAVLIGGGFAYPFIRRRRRSTERAPSAPAGSALSRLELELRKAELVAGLAALDERFEAGLLPEAEYRELRTARKGTLAELLRALGEESGGVPGQTTEGGGR